MKRLKRETLIGIFSNAAVAAIIVCVFAFTLASSPAAITSGGGY